MWTAYDSIIESYLRVKASMKHTITDGSKPSRVQNRSGVKWQAQDKMSWQCLWNAYQYNTGTFLTI